MSVAARLYTQALPFVGPDEPERRVRYLLGRASCETDLRLLGRAEQDIAEARELAADLGDPGLVARGVLAQGEFEQKSGDLDAALDTVQSAVDLFVAAGNIKGQADAQRVQGMTHIYRGEYDAAEVSITAALDASRALEDRRGEAWALQNLAWISYIEGRADEAEDRLTASVATFQELGDSGGLSWAVGLLAFVRFHQGQLYEAEALGQQILVEARERGDRWGEGMMLLLTSGVRLWSGRASEAVTAGEEALVLFLAIADRFGEAQARAGTGRALVTAGRVADGLHLLRESLDRQSPAAADEPDNLRWLIAASLAGAAVQVGAPELALDTLGHEPGPELEPTTIGHSDALVADALARLQLGEVEAAVDRLLPVVEAEGTSEPASFALSVLALALAAAGRDLEARDAATQVRAARRSTYLDRVNAGLAELFSLVRTDPSAADAAVTVLLAEADAVDDPVAQAVVRLAGATALGGLDPARASSLDADAEQRLAALAITADGWRRLFRQAHDADPARAASRD
jgi:tetratricopeptide (TPR) repeat protein